MSREDLHEFIASGAGNESNICQVSAFMDGITVYEDCWRGYRNEDAVNVNSVTKGVMALLAVIALDRGYIEDADQKVMDFFPDYKVKRGEKNIFDVKVRH